MKTKKIMLLCVLFAFNAIAQKETSVTILGGLINKDLSFDKFSIKNIQSFEGRVGVNFSEFKNNYEVNLSHAVFYDGSYIPVNFSVSKLELGYMYKAFSSNNNLFYFSLGGGVFGGYETIESNPTIILSKSGFTYGVYAGANIDFYLTDRVDLILRFQENYYIQTVTGKMNPFLGLGTKINFK